MVAAAGASSVFGISTPSITWASAWEWRVVVVVVGSGSTAVGCVRGLASGLCVWGGLSNIGTAKTVQHVLSGAYG